MSDNKRVVLTTLEPQKVSERIVKKQCKTVRICVALPESNEDKCPEYNYKDELASVKKKSKQISKDPIPIPNVPNGLDSFDNENENDDDVRRIALEMEAKYGSGITGELRKKRKGRKDDYADIGAGYDESDSFIDNTDGYDEIIPPNVTTLRGGFYINSGALEFKTDDKAMSEVSSSSSDENDSEEEQNAEKSKRKRVLETTDEEPDSDVSNQGEKKQKVDKPNISMHQAIKKKLFSSQKIKKHRLADLAKKSVKDLLRERRHDLNMSIPDLEDNAEKEALKENKRPMKLDSVSDAIESVINRTDPKENFTPVANENKSEEETESLLKPAEKIFLVEGEKPNDLSQVEIIKLPENLPTDILGLIENIKKAARDYKDGGKVKFFSGEVNVMLLNLERKCKCLGRSSRVKVYEHLSPFVRCRKETLIKRAKNLVIEEEQKKLKKTIEKLKIQIDQTIPSLIRNYEVECQKVLQRKFSQEAATNEELKSLKAPRRRFPLSEEMKRMVKDILGLKKRCLLHEGKQKNCLEDLLTEYLKKYILILWPEGWMSMTVLKKFCNSATLKTPDSKGVNCSNPNKHSQKIPASSTIMNFSPGNNNLTITPINLSEKLNEVSNNNINPNSKVSETIIKPLVKELPEKQPEATAKPVIKEEVEKQNDVTDNGVIVINTGKSKEEAVIPNDSHCQVIDLTDTTNSKLKLIQIEESPSSFYFSKDHTEAKVIPSFESTLKNKFPDISVSTANSHNDRDDVQKVMESLKALQKLSSPSKNEATSSSVSVIAFNKNYSNSGSSQNNSGGSGRTDFSGAVGFQDEFQKQFISSLSNNIKSAPVPSKTGYNRCS